MNYATVQKHPRYQHQMNVDLRFPRGPVLTVSTENISLGGLFVLTHEVQPPGTQLLVRVRMRAVSFTCTARVVHVKHETVASEHQPVGMGLEFEEMSPFAESRLQRVVHTAGGLAPATLSHAAAIASLGQALAFKA